MLNVTLTQHDISNARYALSPVNQLIGAAARRTGSAPLRPGRPTEFSGVATSESAAWMVINLLSSQAGGWPDFLTPPPSPDPNQQCWSAELDLIASTPPDRLVEDLRDYRFDPGMRDLHALASGEQRALKKVVAGLVHLHKHLYGPKWIGLQRALREDIQRRSLDAGYGGFERALSQIHPRLTYDRGTLTLRSPRSGPDVRSAGRGFVLVPSIVRPASITMKMNSRDPIVLVYPLDPGGAVEAATHRRPAFPARRQLGSLIGTTRGDVLAALFGQPQLSTSMLADACHIAVSTASEHATVLRQAGLISSSRDRNRVLHSLTPLGVQLLTGGSH